MQSATTWLGIVGALVMVVLMAKGVRGAIIGGILMVTFISWIPDHQASYLGAGSTMAGGFAGRRPLLPQ
jgi:AGZA family xanthine/uracil permease-like MFS transporter